MTKATLLQIDLQNLFFEARNRGQKIDLERIWTHFSERESEFLTDALVYMIRSEDFDSAKFEVKLKTVGYNLKIKNSVKIIGDSCPKCGANRTFYRGNHDVGIAVDCLDKIDSFQKWILMSGDGDFVDLCKYLKSKHKQIEIWSFKECYNPQLEPYADKMYFIEEDFFLKRPRITVFGFRNQPAD